MSTRLSRAYKAHLYVRIAARAAIGSLVSGIITLVYRIIMVKLHLP